MSGFILTLNAGSSSVKFALYERASSPRPPQLVAEGQVESLGANASLTVKSVATGRNAELIGPADHAGALDAILSHESGFLPLGAIVAGVGHRIVHGGKDFAQPRILDHATLAVLEDLAPLAPLHQPHNLAGVAAAQRAFPNAVQVGCFDTAFHRGHDFVEEAFALPRRYYDQGVRRYGFHGLSCEFIAGELARVAPQIASGRVIVAHLGNGASMCAMHDGRSLASTMGFSTLDGLAMGTRSGQIDPGVLLYLLQHEKLDALQMSDLLYKESGLLGLSGISHDMRTLEASGEAPAKAAIGYFIHRIKRETGALAAVLGGLDGLVFTGGIGENSRLIRAGVCEGMQWLGISIDEAANAGNAMDIGVGRVRVMVVATDEESVIAGAVQKAIG